MKAVLFAAAPLLLGGGCFYSLDLEGKACNYSDHPCPAGYTCAPAGDGGGICRRQADGGGDGGDVGPCVEGQKACVAGQPQKISVCHQGFWREESCEGATYCYFTSPQSTVVDCVAPCQNDDQCRQADFCNSERGHCEPKGDCSPPGAKRCLFKPGYDAVEECDSRSGNWKELPCDSQQYCHERYLRCLPECSTNLECRDLPDAQIPEPNSCDQGQGKCRYLSFCKINSDCGAGFSCVSDGDRGVCVKQPAISSSADISCFKTAVPSDNGSASACSIEGYVVESIRSSDQPTTPKTIGLELEVFRLEDVLYGDLKEPLARVTVSEQGGAGYFQTPQVVPTRANLVFRVRADAESQTQFVETFTFGYYLRADECGTQGKAIMHVPAMETGIYQSYIGAGVSILPDPSRGLVIARLRDCTPNRIENAAVAVSMNSQQNFFIVSGLLPDAAAEVTDRLGYFGASNAQSIEGVLGALVKEGASYVYLGPYPLRVFPGAASMVLVEKPKRP